MCVCSRSHRWVFCYIKKPLKYAKATDVRGYNNTYATSIATQRHLPHGDSAESTAAGTKATHKTNTNRELILLGMSSGEVLRLSAMLGDARTAATTGEGGASPSPSPSSSSPPTPSTSPMRSGLISKAFGTSGSGNQSTTIATSADGSITVFMPEGGVLENVSCTCLSFIPRRMSSTTTGAGADVDENADDKATAETAGGAELFAAAYSDGSIIFYDTSKDPKADPNFDEGGSGSSGGEKSTASGGKDDDGSAKTHSKQQQQQSGDADLDARRAAASTPRSFTESTDESMLGGYRINYASSSSPSPPACTRTEHDPIVSPARNPKASAIQRWRLTMASSQHSAGGQHGAAFSSPYLSNANTNTLNALEVSPDARYIATGSRDGLIRILSIASGTLVSGVRSYYGATLCVAWSPDSRYLLSGGEDDKIMVYGMREKRVMAFLEGHTSYVSSIAFDPSWSAMGVDTTAPSGGGENGTEHHVSSEDYDDVSMWQYRAVSGGQDAKLCFWDLAIEDDFEHRPANDLSSAFSSKVDISGAGGSDAAEHSVIVDSPKRLSTPRVSPVMCHIVHPEPIVKVIVDRGDVFSIDQSSRVRMWTATTD